MMQYIKYVLLLAGWIPLLSCLSSAQSLEFEHGMLLTVNEDVLISDESEPMEMEFILNIDHSIRLGLIIHSRSEGKDMQTAEVFIKGNRMDKIETPGDGQLHRSEILTTRVFPGENPIRIQAESPLLSIESIELLDLDDFSSSYQVTADLGNAEAMENSQILFDYLKSIYGKKTLSGQMDLTWNDSVDMLERVYEDTGKYPALQGFDFMNIKGRSSGTRQTEEAIAWWNNAKGTGRNGIVTFCWHWRDPLKPGDSGEFYTNKTGFRIPYNVETGQWMTETEEYTAMMGDIDQVAAELKKLEEEGVPVLWRPLHEASGGWFWWGDSGIPAYRALWNLLYSELNGRHALKNLIWVWNGQNRYWYPGDEVVDIIGEDIYAEPRASLSGADRFTEALQFSEEPKMIALSENGVLPDPEAMRRDRIHWLYFMTWNDAHKGKGISDKDNFWTGEYHNENSFKKKVYEDDLIITLDELPVFTEK